MIAGGNWWRAKEMLVIRHLTANPARASVPVKSPEDGEAEARGKSRQ